MFPHLLKRFSCRKLLLLLLIVGGGGTSQLPSEPNDSAWITRGRFVRLLFGDHQWKLGQYCDAHYESHLISTSDAQIESLYNGSYLGSIDGTDDWSRVIEHLDGSSRVGLRSRQTLGVVCSANSWDYADPQEEMQSNAPHESASDCQEQLYGLFAFVETLANKTSASQEACENWPSSRPNDCLRESSFNLHYWNQFHSFGRLTSGPPYKENVLLGDFDSCVRLNSTRYCLGSFGPQGGGTERALYQIGLCLPRACSSSSLRRSERNMRILDVLVKRNLPGIVQGCSRNQLIDVFCPPSADSHYKNVWAKDNVAKMLLYVLPPFWLLLLIYGTFFHKMSRVNSPQGCDEIMSSFSLCSNWRKFTNSRDLNPKLAGLNSLKTLAINWLMITHISMTILPYVKNLNELSSYYANSLHGPIVLQGQHGVPLFFTMSGIIFGVKYLRRRKANEGPEVSFKQMILWRYFRLAPMYLLVYAYIKKFSHLVGNGPLWDSGVSSQSEVRQCLVEAWTVPLLMLANFTPPFAHCLITGWHIANDFQIYLMLPFLVVAYRRSRVHGTLVVFAAFSLTHLSHIWFWATSENYDLIRLVRDPFRFGPRFILDRLALDYVNPLGRLGTYFLGVLVADLLLALDLDQQTQINEPHMIKVNDLAVQNQRQLTTFIEHQYRQQSTTSEQVNVSVAKRGDHQRLNDKSRESMTAPSTTTSVERPTDKDQIHDSLLATFKDTCLLALGVLLTVMVLFSVLFPADGITFLGAYTKALAYPSCRITIELSWSILLYYLLRTNQKGRGAGKARARNGRADSSSSSLSLKATTREATDGTTATRTREKLLPAPGEENNNNNNVDDDDENQRQFFLTRLLKLPTWNILVKLNYGLMLTHYALIRAIVQHQRELFLFTWANFFQFVTFILMASYLFAFTVHLAIEMPLSALAQLFVSRVLLSGKSGSKTSK